MKKITKIIALIVTINVANAQITLTSSDFPTLGQTWYGASDTTSNNTIGSGGINKIWNFPTLIPHTTFSQPFSSVSAAPSAWNSNFPNATMVSYVPSDAYATYFNSNSNGFYIDGFYDGNSQVGSQPYGNFNPDWLLIPTPFTYNNTRNHVNRTISTFTTSGTVFKAIILSYQEFNADATGNLTTPVGTFNNVLRVKELHFSIDSVYMVTGGGDQFMYATPKKDTTITYGWYKNGSNCLLLQMEEKMQGPNPLGTSKTSTYYGATTLGIGSYHLESATLFPNPSNGNKTLNIKTSDKHFITKIDVYDLTGKLVKTEQINNTSSTTINIEDLQVGVYLYKLYNIHDYVFSTGKFEVTK